MEKPILASDENRYYLKFNDLEIHSTKVVCDNGELVTVDLAGDGTVVGVEIIKQKKENEV